MLLIREAIFSVAVPDTRNGSPSNWSGAAVARRRVDSTDVLTAALTVTSAVFGNVPTTTTDDVVFPTARIHFIAADPDTGWGTCSSRASALSIWGLAEEIRVMFRLARPEAVMPRVSPAIGPGTSVTMI
jgi:hypothetical protein